MPNSGHNYGWHMDIKKVLTTPEAPYWQWQGADALVHVVGYLMTGAATFCGQRLSDGRVGQVAAHVRTTCLTCLAAAPQGAS